MIISLLPIDNQQLTINNSLTYQQKETGCPNGEGQPEKKIKRLSCKRFAGTKIAKNINKFIFRAFIFLIHKNITIFVMSELRPDKVRYFIAGIL